VTAGASLALAASVLDGGGRALSGHALEWSARNPGVVDVDRQTGLLKATAPGRATIEVRSGELKASVSVVVTPAVVAQRDVVPDSSPARAASPPPAADTARPETPATFLVRTLAAGGNSACVTLRGGGTACWGAGTGAPATVDARAFGELAVGGSHRCGLAGGVAHCWGSNGMGQLGDGSTTSRGRPAAVQGGAQFTAIAAGGSHTCALDRGGKAHCWGSNAAGQLGIGGRGGNAQVPTPVQTDLTFQAIAAKQHTCARCGRRGVLPDDGFSGPATIRPSCRRAPRQTRSCVRKAMMTTSPAVRHRQLCVLLGRQSQRPGGRPEQPAAQQAGGGGPQPGVHGPGRRPLPRLRPDRGRAGAVLGRQQQGAAR
jgi:hypothetical protein